MKKTEVIVILLFFLLVSMILAQEEIKLDQSAEKVDIHYEEGCEVLEEDGYKIYTFKKIDENAKIDCSYIKIEGELYPNVKEGYLKLKGNEIVEANFIAKENSSYKFLINNELKTIDVDKGTKLVYKDGRLEVYGNINNFEVSEGNKVSLFNIESLEKPIVLEEDKVKGKFKFRDIKVDGVLKISSGKYILEEGSAEFEDVRDVDGFVLNVDTEVKNDFGIISYPSKIERDGKIVSVFPLDSEPLNLFYEDDKGFEGNKIVFSHGVNPYSGVGEEILMLDSSEGSFVFDRTGNKVKIVDGEVSGGALPNFNYKSNKERGNLLLNLKNIGIYSSEGRGTIAVNKKGKFGNVYMYLADKTEDTSWIPARLRDDYGVHLFYKITNPKTISSLMEMGLDLSNVYDVEIYGRGDIDVPLGDIVHIEGIFLENRNSGNKLGLANIDLKGFIAEAGARVAPALTFGLYNPVKKEAKEYRKKIYDRLVEQEIPENDASRIADMIKDGLVKTKGNFWIRIDEVTEVKNVNGKEEEAFKLVVKTMTLDLKEIDKRDFEGNYMNKFRDALLQ